MRRRVQESPTAGRPAVEVVRFAQSAPVVTIDQRSPCWEDPEHTSEYHREAEGAFVRLRPPEVSDAVLERVVNDMKGVAVALRIDPRPRAAVVPNASLRPTTMGARAVVFQLVDEAHTHDRDALRLLCEEIAAGAGL